MAIHTASAKLRARNGDVDGSNGTAGEDMKGHAFYILPKPCPMCMSAMAYCGPDEIVFCTTREEYSKYYRDDRRHVRMETFNEALQILNQTVPMRYVAHPGALDVYKEWHRLNVEEKQTAPATKAAPAPSAASGGPHAASARAECPFAKPMNPSRPEVEVDGQSIPAWRSASELAALMGPGKEEHVAVVAHRGDPLQAFARSMRELNKRTRGHYAQFISDLGRHIRPVVIASDYEPGFEGVGSTFTLLRRDGTMERLAPCPVEYEIYKAASHLVLGISSVVSPYFRAPEASGWQEHLRGFLRGVETAKHNVAAAGLPADATAHLQQLFDIVEAYCSGCIERGSVDVDSFQAFTAKAMPFVHGNMANAARIQAHADLDALLQLKARLGDEWRDLYFVIPTVWPVAGDNPRERMLAMLMDSDRVSSRIVKMEGKSGMDDILTTLGRVIGDRAVASLVFGDSTKFTRDSKLALSTPRDLVSSGCVDAMLEYMTEKTDKVEAILAGAPRAHIDAVKSFVDAHRKGADPASVPAVRDLYDRPMSMHEFARLLAEQGH